MNKIQRSNGAKSAIQYVYGDDAQSQQKLLSDLAARKGYAVVATVNASPSHDEFMASLRKAKAAGAVLLYFPNEVLDKAAANFRGVRIETPRLAAA